MQQGGDDAAALLEHLQRRCTLYLPEEIPSLAKSGIGWEQAKERETVAFATWKGRVRKRIEEGNLPITLEELQNMDVRDMMDDVRAHANMKRTQDRGEELKRAFEHSFLAQLKGVLTWYDHLAREDGEEGCEDFDEMLIDLF